MELRPAFQLFILLPAAAARDASLHTEELSRRARDGAAAVEDQLVSGQYEALSLPLHRQQQRQRQRQYGCIYYQRWYKYLSILMCFYGISIAKRNAEFRNTIYDVKG